MSKPKILITNDDGIVAPGINALVEVAKSHGDVLVVAPDKPQSGQGHAITIEDPLRIERLNIFDDIPAYACSGTPADCVKLAKDVLLKNQNLDLCLSGINHGSNSSVNILYSGTMSAAMEASLDGIKSIGFSLLDFGFDADLTAAKHYVNIILEKVLNNKQNIDCNLLNVNIPYAPLSEIKGIKVCRQCRGKWVENFKESFDPRGRKYYWMTGKFVNLDSGSDTDIWALENNYVSVVPCFHDLTLHQAIPSLKYIENN